MDRKKAKLFGIAIIFVSFLIISLNSLLATNPSILDTDSSTYIVVVMLMLFLFIIFSAKEDLDLSFNRRNAMYAIAVFIIYALLLSSLRVALSSAFLSYRIDALLFPLPLLALVVLVFGTRSIKRLWPVIVYSVFASPLPLLPVIKLSTAFANLNAILVYDVIRAFGIQVFRSGYVITSVIGSSITISTACVPVGTFIAFVMFLLPVAYLCYGKLERKLYWIVSGTALMLLLNFVRMLLIALAWVFYGLDNAVSIFHLFAGQVIFYASIIIMMLLVGKYGLSFASRAKKTRRKAKRPAQEAAGLPWAIVIALAIAVVAFALNYGYANGVHASAVLFATNNGINAVSLNNRMIDSVEGSGANITVLGTTSAGEMFLIGNKQNHTSFSYVIAETSYSPLPDYIIPGYTPIGYPHAYLLKNGITVKSQRAYSGNATFDLNYFSVPYNITGKWVMVDYVIFRETDANYTSGCAPSSNYMNAIGYFESAIYNFFAIQGMSNNGFVCETYAIASR